MELPQGLKPICSVSIADSFSVVGPRVVFELKAHSETVIAEFKSRLKELGLVDKFKFRMKNGRVEVCKVISGPLSLKGKWTPIEGQKRLFLYERSKF